jgi:N-methylhydantoinase A
MSSAARQYVAEKGLAPSELTLVAFGGAGPVHALGLARKLGCARVVVPPFPGVMSSLGLLAAPVAFERSQAVRKLATAVSSDDLEVLLKRLEADAPCCRRTPSRRWPASPTCVIPARTTPSK